MLPLDMDGSLPPDWSLPRLRYLSMNLFSGRLTAPSLVAARVVVPTVQALVAPALRYLHVNMASDKVTCFDLEVPSCAPDRAGECGRACGRSGPVRGCFTERSTARRVP